MSVLREFEVDRDLVDIFYNFLEKCKIFDPTYGCDSSDIFRKKKQIERTKEDVENFFNKIEIDYNCYCLDKKCKSYEDIKKSFIINRKLINLTEEDLGNGVEVYDYSLFTLNNNIIKCKTCKLEYSIDDLIKDAVKQHNKDIITIKEELKKIEHLEKFWKKTKDGYLYFENDVFSVMCYFEDNEEDLPNFYHKPSNLKIEWYKYPFRSSTSNRKFTKQEFKDILYDCFKSLKI